MAYKSKAMQKWAGENQPSPARNYEYKSAAMRNYEANMAKKAQQEEAERQQALLAQQEAEAPRRATLRDLTLGSIGKGYATSRYGNERYDEIMLGTQRQAKQAQKAKEKLEQEKYNFEAKSKAGQAVSGAGELIGQIAYNLTNKDTLGSVGANVAGASAVGAVVPLPEELVTIPVAVGRGLKMGSAATSFQVSAAQAYDEMLEAGVSPKTAKTVANVIGGGVAALDAMQVDELAKGFKLAKNAKTEAGEKAAANIAKALAKVGKSTAIETGQEVAQEAVTMVGQDVAKRQEGIKTFSGEEYKQRLGDTAVQSALSFGLLGGAGAVGGAVMNRNNVKTQANEANRADNEAENVEKNKKNNNILSNNVEESRKLPNNVEKLDNTNNANIAENAPLTAENGTKSSKTAVNNTENADLRANITSERYGTEGKKVFESVKTEPQKATEFDAYYREGVMGKAMPAVEGVLNETEAISAYNAGKIDGETNRTAYAQKQYVVSQNAGLNVESAKNLSMGDRIVYNAMGKAFGKEVVVVPELINTDGTRSNAKIDLANGRIYIAEDAQNGGRVALAHEVIHDMRVAAPTEFDNLAKLVTDYHKRFNSYDSKFADTAKLYELDKGKINYYDMMEEMVADFIADNKGAERIVDMLSTDKTLAQKFIDSVKKAVVKLGKLALDKETRKIVNEWEDLVKQLEKAVKATEQKVKETKYPADAKIGDDSFVVNEVRESKKSAKYDIEQDIMRQDLVKYGVFTEAESYQFVKNLSDLIDNVITPNAAILDMNEEFGKDDRKNISYKPNDDKLYKVSLDFSTLCKKRLMTQYVTEQLQLRLGRAITNKEQLAIRDRLLELKKENDSIEVACALCYVEAARLKSPVQINRFLKDRTGYMTKYFAKANKEFDEKVKQAQKDIKVAKGYDANAVISHLPHKDKMAIYNAARKMRMEYKPSAEEMAVIEIANSLDDRAFLTLGNLEKLAEEQPDIYKAFSSHVTSSTHSKDLQGNTAYYYGDSRREGVSDALIVLMNAENGLRHQPWSDFQSIHLLDTIVAIAELSTRKAKMQAYTKVPNFVKLVGRTGMMINLSLVPDGKTGFINGKLAFSNIEGMDFETAKKLRDTYANTTGTIAIGINDQQIKALLVSGEIDYVIPYHASGLNKELRRIVKLESWDDYQNKQSEKKIEGYANLANNPDWHKKPDFSEWFKADEIDTTKDGVTIMREAAERYKQLCRERGLKPKFDDFKNEPNYWKLLIDRKMVDHKTGKIIMQEAVRPVFDFDVISEMLTEEVQSYDANLNERLMDTLVGFYGDGGKNSEISQRIKQLDKEGKARETAKKKGVYEAYEQFPMIDVAVAGDERYSKKREPDIPDGYKERGFNESVRTKTDYDDIVQQEFIDNPEIYKQLANKVTKEKAKAIMDKGLAFAETEFPKLLERMDATAIALGDMMAREYSNMGEYDKAVTVIRDMAKQLTKAGQFSQAAVIALTKSNPMTALAYAKRDIDKLNADGYKQFGKKWKDFEITAEEEQMFKNIKQGDEDAIKAAYEKINKRIAREYPSTIWQKFIEASRISMLLNPRTNVKNVVSNLLLYPVTRGSGILSSKLQKVYAYYNKDYKPNQSGLLKKDIRKQAEGVWDKVKDTFDTTSKYNEGIKANKRDTVVFKEGMGTRVMENIAPGTLHKLNTVMGKDDAGLMETLRHATYWLLEYGDNIFVKQNFISRFGSYMQAKGITDVNTMSEEDMAAAIDVAYREAMRATFKDDTALSKWMASIKHTGNPYIDAMMEMIMPFTKTPANIAMRGIDYSPIGLINTITKAKKGADASEVIDELSKNLLGSALIAFGAWLFGKGIVTGGEPENEKEAAFLKQQGWQPYAVMTPNGYVTYDWAQPAAIPIIMGVTIMESLEEGRLGVVDAVKNAGVASFNQWVELSPLQSLKEVMGGYGTVGENLLNTAIEMPQRLIPSALGATARTADTTQRLTYSKGNVAQTQKDLAKSKVPGLSQTLPAVYDTWGREKKRDDSTGLAAFNQFINPSSYKGVNATEADREINRLYNELGDSAIYPRKASYSIEKGGKTYTLSNAEYSEYQRIMGQLSYDSVKALMAKPAYDELTDYEKAEIIKDIYDNAFEKAKYAIMEGQGYKKTEEDIRTAKETKIKQAYLEATPENIAEYYIAYYVLNNADSDKTASGTTIAGSKKKNGINRLVELGYSRTEARRLYDRLKG